MRTDHIQECGVERKKKLYITHFSNLKRELARTILTETKIISIDIANRFRRPVRDLVRYPKEKVKRTLKENNDA